MVMMEMTAIESLKDPNMLYLDIVSGLGGIILFVALLHGVNNYNCSPSAYIPCYN